MFSAFDQSLNVYSVRACAVGDCYREVQPCSANCSVRSTAQQLNITKQHSTSLNKCSVHVVQSKCSVRLTGALYVINGSCNFTYIPLILSLFSLAVGTLIAWIYDAADFKMENRFAFLWGGGQAFALFIISFVRILATL